MNIFYQYISVILVLLFLICLNDVQSSGFGRCPNYPSMPKFNMTKFLGVWYEVERSFYFPEIASSCTTLTFENLATKNNRLDRQIQVTVKAINHWTGNPSVNSGFATPVTEYSSIMDFKFSSSLPAVIAQYLPGAGRYQVLYTDYDNFAILWSCSGISYLGHTDQIWLMARDRMDFPVDLRTKIYDILTKLTLDSDRLVLSSNKNCSMDS